jgi:hypothetical protein
MHRFHAVNSGNFLISSPTLSGSKTTTVSTWHSANRIIRARAEKHKKFSLPVNQASISACQSIYLSALTGIAFYADHGEDMSTPNGSTERARFDAKCSIKKPIHNQ